MGKDTGFSGDPHSGQGCRSGILRVELITSRAGALGEVGHERTGIVRPLERARKCL